MHRLPGVRGRTSCLQVTRTKSGHRDDIFPLRYPLHSRDENFLLPPPAGVTWIHIQTELDVPSVFVTKSEPSSYVGKLFAKNSQFPLDFLDAIVGGDFMNVLIYDLLAKVEFFPSAVLSVTKIFVWSVRIATVANTVRSLAGYKLFNDCAVIAFVVGQTLSLIFKLSDVLCVCFKKYLVVAHLIFNPFPLSCV